MDVLTEARETNKRLNRRLGSMENHLHSMVSRAQRDTAAAQRIATTTQDQVGYWVRRYSDHVSEICSLKEAINRMGWWIAGLALWGITATIIAIATRAYG